eukprot:2996872-Lingulodinium_polyedra.AAC.1
MRRACARVAAFEAPRVPAVRAGCGQALLGVRPRQGGRGGGLGAGCAGRGGRGRGRVPGVVVAGRHE